MSQEEARTPLSSRLLLGLPLLLAVTIQARGREPLGRERGGRRKVERGSGGAHGRAQGLPRVPGEGVRPLGVSTEPPSPAWGGRRAPAEGNRIPSPSTCRDKPHPTRDILHPPWAPWYSSVPCVDHAWTLGTLKTLFRSPEPQPPGHARSQLRKAAACSSMVNPFLYSD